MRRLLLSLSLVAAGCLGTDTSSDTTAVVAAGSADASSTTTTVPATSSTSTTTTTTTTTPAIDPESLHRFSDPRLVGEPRLTAIEGLLSFRGNQTRTWYGRGPVPTDPQVLWSFGQMCGPSTVGGETTTWCGTGWTGQPVVWERPDGVTEVIFGAYDHAVHFLDAATGEPTRPSFVTGDLIKGSVTLDPDGFPLLYFGSRDNKLRVVALDRQKPTELWVIDADEWQGIWNNDFDGNPMVVDDLLFEGGENAIFYAVKLNRGYNANGRVVVDPEVLTTVRSWNDELVNRVGRNVSIENSVALYEDTVYFANSGGRVMGVDVSNVEAGEAPVVFDYWVGDDVDASIVIDADGMLYVPVELERFNNRSQELGQLIKLDPSRPDDPYVWGVPVPPRGGGDGGLWATPALGEGVLYVATHPGELLVVATDTGDVLWRDEVGSHAWSSPVLVDETLLVSVNCEEGGGLRAYDVSDPRQPVEQWQLDLGTGCIESTPAVWKGVIYVGSRDGNFYAFG